eukprot:scaffold84951_cov72-Phaeocystis_antarctica.AAC.1
MLLAIALLYSPSSPCTPRACPHQCPHRHRASNRNPRPPSHLDYTHTRVALFYGVRLHTGPSAEAELHGSGVCEWQPRSSLFLLGLGLGHVVGVLPQDDDALYQSRERQVLVGRKLGLLAHGEQHGRGVRLEARDLLGPPRQPHHINLLPDAHGHGQRLELLVDRHQHARAHRPDERPQQEVVLAQHDGLEVHADVHHHEQAGERHRVADAAAAVRVVRRQRDQALACVREALRQSHREEHARLLGVVGGERAQVVRELGQRVGHDHVGRVGGGEQREAQRHRAPYGRVAVLQHVQVGADGHLRAELLPHGHHGDAQRRHAL